MHRMRKDDNLIAQGSRGLIRSAISGNAHPARWALMHMLDSGHNDMLDA